ncbi:7314_t:CDS:2, partial [Diversispora eburnea]
MTVLENVNLRDFNDAIKCNILKSMIVLTQNNFVNPTVNINSSNILRARIRPLLLRVVNNDAQVLGFLKSHLTGDFYTWMRIANSGRVDVFFTKLKNMWLKCAPNLNGQVLQQSSYNTKIIEAPIILQSVPVSQTVEPVRQSRGSPSNLKMEEDYGKYYLTKFLNDLINSRLDEKVDEIENMLSHLDINNQFQKPVIKLNPNEENNGYDKEKDIWYDLLKKKTNITNNGSEFGALNNIAINTLGWKADKPSDFDIK